MSYTECMKSELDLFARQPLQTNILKTEQVGYKPLTSLENPTTIEFACFGHGDAYFDLSSIMLRFKLQITKADGITLYAEADANQVGFVNNILHSMIQQVNVSLNGKNISTPDNNYAYRAYIESLLNYGNDAGKTHLETCGWIADSRASNNLANLDGLKLRTEKTKNSNILEVVGKLHADMLNQPLLLLNNVDVRISLSLHKPEFYILGADTDNSSVKILSATMTMNHVTVNPNIMIAHHKILEKTNAIYPYKKVEVKAFTVSPKGNIISLENVVLGQIPTRLVFAMVDTDAYAGKKSKNPYNFKHNNISSFALSVNGSQIPGEPIEMDFTKNNITARAYSTLFEANGILHANEGNLITLDQFNHGYFLLAFDLTADSTGNTPCKALTDQGTVRIEARFEAAITNTITCLVFLEYDTFLEIDKARNVILNN